MIVYKRFAILLSLVTFILIFILFRTGDGLQPSKAWRKVPQLVGLGEWVADEEEIPISYREHDVPIHINSSHSLTSAILGNSSFSAPDEDSQFIPGQPKPPGSTYSKAVIIGRISSENMSWLDEAALSPSIQTYIYTVDDPSPSNLLRVPKNKGHEAMVYLTYIIDHYHDLTDISIFLHAHKMAWHNNELLNHDAHEMITRLSAEHVTRQGYMSLRCHWHPGCPEWVHPGVIGIPDINRPEEGAMATAWSTLFPDASIPSVIGTPCCAQFALSRQRIQSIPLDRYVHFRNYLLSTPLPDGTSGRVFEYLWSYIFTSQTTFCPDQRICYCDAYGVCFDDESSFDHWFEMKYQRATLHTQLEEWRKQADDLAAKRLKWGGIEEKEVVIPNVRDEDIRLTGEINALTRELERKRHEAMDNGRDPRVRAKVAGRAWREGDGF